MRWLVALICALLIQSCSNENEASKPKIYRIARESSWYASNLFGKEQNVFAFADELIDTVADREGLLLEKMTVDSTKALWSLRHDKIDLLITPIGTQSAQIKDFDFSNSCLPFGQVLLVPSDSPYISLEQMDRRVVGVKQGAALSFSSQMHPNAVIKYYDDPAMAVEKLAAGSIDAVVLSYFAAFNFEHTLYKGRVKAVLPPLTDKGLRIVALEGTNNRPFLEKFNHGLASVKADGTYDKLIKKWDLPSLVK